MFGRSRATLEVLDAGLKALVELADVTRKTQMPDGAIGELKARIEDLELSRAKWEAETEALVLKAKGQYQAAAASEARARTQAKHDESLAPERPPESPKEIEEAWDTYFQERNGAPSEEERVLEVPVGVETSGKAAALRRKFS